MRVVALLLGTSLLSACGAGSGGGVASGGTVIPGGGTTTNHTFANPTEAKTYQAIGASHSYDYSVALNNVNGTTTGGVELYRGNATTARNSGLSIKYDPRDAIFEINLSDNLSGTSLANRFQDPAHRTDFGGAVEPQSGTPRLTLPGLQFLQSAASGNNASLIPNTLIPIIPTGQSSATYNQDTFFYQKPGTTTQYVTFAGFLRNNVVATRVDTDAVPATATTPAIPATSVTTYAYKLSRGAAVFGENTLNQNVPTSGTGSFTGNMLASMVFNDRIDSSSDAPTYFQWIEGSANGSFNFGSNTFTLDLTGTTFAPQLDGLTSGTHTIQSGAIFNARGNGRIDLISAGGFLGAFNQAWFINPGNNRIDLNIAGSSINGAFFGPRAQEIGGSYRIVGGTPDERIDILGVFTGK